MITILETIVIELRYIVNKMCKQLKAFQNQIYNLLIRKSLVRLV